MNKFVVLTDTRQQKESHILKTFDENKILHIRTTLPSADYMALRFDDEKGMYLDYSTLIDTKQDLEEISSNLCNTTNHERIKREIARAREHNCKDFIFLIQDNKIKTAEDIKNWSSPHTKVKGITLLKIMVTMKQKYGVRFIICKKSDMGKKIVELLSKK